MTSKTTVLGISRAPDGISIACQIGAQVSTCGPMSDYAAMRLSQMITAFLEGTPRRTDFIPHSENALVSTTMASLEINGEDY